MKVMPSCASSLSMLVGLLLAAPAMAELQFSGNLRDSSCQPDAASAALEVTFLDAPVQQFRFAPGHSAAKAFAIQLNHCQPEEVGKLIKVIFTGEEEGALPGALKVSGNNSGKLAIQLFTADGRQPVRLGASDVGGDAIAGDAVTLRYSARVQATPEALSNGSVQPGDYSAIATYQLSYQ
ncbi:fimbrial protein [Pantoea sp. 1.19]|uniref:fimbrial protein n=1 Tax=Pantoea sp. 1.19 TaxID=1925589 RepID=UPI0014817E12|nr:fimbrial protein [Pantoea sp. 1.19]